ncbi:MAG: TPM domain-containing protein [Muribaculaceae bacterium]|nr:TPM domain-containing protein [Muribaculaceae bacterium]
MKYPTANRPLALACALIMCVCALAQVPPAPNPPRLVNDFANIFTAQQIAVMEDSLETFTRETSNRIVVVTMNKLGGLEPMEMATRIGSEWGVGDKEKRNGVVVLVKPKTDSPGKVFISVGYGLEGAITDALCSQIIRHNMIPHFRTNDYYGGVTEALSILTAAAKGEYNDEVVLDDDTDDFYATLLLIILIVVIVMIIGSHSGKNGGKGSGGSGMGPIIFGPTFGGSHRSGGFGGSSGGDGFGGFGGGFGGFGGGGAGGSW